MQTAENQVKVYRNAKDYQHDVKNMSKQGWIVVSTVVSNKHRMMARDKQEMVVTYQRGQNQPFQPQLPHPVKSDLPNQPLKSPPVKLDLPKQPPKPLSRNVKIGCGIFSGLIVLILIIAIAASVASGSQSPSTSESSSPSDNAASMGQPTMQPTQAPTEPPTPTLSPAQLEKAYKASTTDTTVVALDKDGNNDQGEDVHFMCTILNFVKDSNGNTAGANVDDPNSSSVIQVAFPDGTDLSQLNTGDTLEVWGTDDGTSSGTNAFGATIQEVGVTALYMTDQTTGYSTP